jgi:uncharacterized coiled-coil protein SlyX
MSFECNFCAHLFTTKQSLKTHQRFAKYCLGLQGQQLVYTFQCALCGKNMLEKRQLEKHQEKCGTVDKVAVQEKTIIKLREINTLLKQRISDQSKQISDLQDKLKDVAIKCAQNPQPLTTLST